MAKKKSFDLSDVNMMTSLIDSIFSEMNIGLVIYQMEDLTEVSTLKLVYANKQAAKYTGTDLSPLLGKYIFEAFPPLAETDIPQIYAQVIKTNQSETIGAVEFGEEKTGKRYYAIKAFPMPNDCVGIIFENITLRKQMEEMIKNYAHQLQEKGAAS